MASGLGLSVEITKPDGATYRWAPDSREAKDIARSIQFSTKRMEGFERGSVVLARRADLDYPDLELYDEVAFIGDDGSTAYEGRVAAYPRTIDDTHSIQVDTAGHMAHARDRAFTGIIIDRDLSAWTEPGRLRRAALVAADWRVSNPTTQTDQADASVLTSFESPWTTAVSPLSEAWYDAGPNNLIGEIYYEWTRGSKVAATTPADYVWQMVVSDDDQGTNILATGDLQASGPGSGTFTPASQYRFAFAQFRWSLGGAAVTSNLQYDINWRQLAVIGDHGLTRQGTGPGGFYASDILRYVFNTYASQLDTSGIQDSSYPIPHLAWKEQITVYDAALQVNGSHLFELECWEVKTVHWAPADLTEADWEVRTDAPGVSVELQGDSSEDLANGIVVEFDNAATGLTEILLPTDYDELRDDSLTNPINRHGLDVWTDIKISSPTTQDAALQIARTVLAEYNQPKAPGTITVDSGYVKHVTRGMQQGWKVRCGQSVRIANFSNDRPRLITETSWDQDSHKLTITVDSTVKKIDAFLDRLGTAMAASNISSAVAS